MGNTAYRNPSITQEAADHEASLSTPEGQPNTTDNEQPVHDWEKRYKDLQSHSSKKQNEYNSDVATLKQEMEQLRIAQTPTFKAPVTEEEMAAFKVKNPETHDFMLTMAHKIAKEQMGTVDNKIASLESGLQNARATEAAVHINAAHPDWSTIKDSQEFHLWAEQQDTVIQAWIYDNPDNAANAIRAINLFKAEVKQVVQPNAQPTSAADSIGINNTVEATGTNRSAPDYVWKDSEIAAMRAQEFAKWEETIDLAISEGRYAPNL